MQTTQLFGLTLVLAYAVNGMEARAQTVAPLTLRTNQSLLGASVGNGVVQGQRVVDIQSKGQPAVGVGVLSPDNHFGSKASVSLLNSARLLGVDGPGNINSPTSLSIRNPKQAPILSTPH